MIVHYEGPNVARYVAKVWLSNAYCNVQWLQSRAYSELFMRDTRTFGRIGAPSDAS
jgi:hypothetical protein